MGRGDKRAVRRFRWKRAVAHLAIVVVFLMAALGYAPFHERAADVAAPAVDAHGAAAKNEHACDTHAGETAVASSRDTAATKNGAVLAHDCDAARAELAFAAKRRAAGEALPDPTRAFKAQPAQ